MLSWIFAKIFQIAIIVETYKGNLWGANFQTAGIRSKVRQFWSNFFCKSRYYKVRKVKKFRGTFSIWKIEQSRIEKSAGPGVDMELWNYGLLGLSASLLAGWITQVSLDNPWSRGLSPKWENPTDELPFSWKNNFYNLAHKFCTHFPMNKFANWLVF